MPDNYGKYITGLHGDPWPTVNYGGTIRLWFRVRKDRGGDPHPIEDNINGAFGDGSLIYIHGKAGRDSGIIDHALLVDDASGTSIDTHMVNDGNSTLDDDTDPDYEVWYHDLDTSSVYWVPRINETQATPGAAASNASGWGTTRYPFDRGVWDICYNGNGKHYDSTLHQNTDAEWYTDVENEQGGYQVRIEIIPGYPSIRDGDGRADMHKRVAGEKAVYDDEFVVKSQILQGRGTKIIRYDNDGVPDDPSYPIDPSRRMDIAIEAIGLVDVGLDIVAGVNLVTGDAIAWTGAVDYQSVDVIRFSDEPDWNLDGALTRTSFIPPTEWEDQSIPVTFKAFHKPDGTIHLSARTAHSGLFISHEAVGGAITQFDAGSHGAISHITFRDTSDGVFVISQGVQESNFGNRYGLNVSYDQTNYTWYAETDADAFIITRTDRVKLKGANGVSITLTEEVAGTDYQFLIDRPLQITNRDEAGIDNDEGAPNTTGIILDSEGVSEATYTEQLRLEAIDEGGGVRRLKAYGKPVADGSPRFKTMEAHKLVEGIAQGHLSINPTIYEGHFYIGPYGVVDGTPNQIMTIADIMDQDSSFEVMDTGFWSLKNQTFQESYAKPMIVQTSGVYKINTKLEGRHHMDPELCSGLAQYMAYDLRLQLTWFGDYGTFHSHTLDRFHFDNMIMPGLVIYGNTGSPVPDSIVKYMGEKEWFLDGHIYMWIPAGTVLLTRMTHHFTGLITAGTTGYWHINPEYHNFEIELITTQEPDTTNLYPSKPAIFPYSY